MSAAEAAEPLARRGSPSDERRPAESGTVDIRPNVVVPGDDWPPPWLVRLMARPAFRGRMAPEQRLAVEVADLLRDLTLSGRLRGVTWSCVPAELPARGRFVAAATALRALMGTVPGVSDYVLTWEDGAGWLELKRPGGNPAMVVRAGEMRLGRTAPGQLSARQRDFREWCRSARVRHAVARSVDEVREILREWRLLA